MSKSRTGINKVYAHFGKAAHEAQLLELEVGNVILNIILSLKKNQKLTAEEQQSFQKIMDDINKSTLGKLFNHIKQIYNLDKDVISPITSILDKTNEKRTYLIHRFFAFHNFAIFSSNARQEMIEELISLTKEFQAGRYLVTIIEKELIKMLGINFSHLTTNDDMQNFIRKRKGEKVQIGLKQPCK